MSLIFEEIVVSVELILVMVELVILAIILAHMSRMGVEDKLLKENIKELNILHRDMHESITLLKRDINELTINNKELQDLMKELHQRLGN